MGPGFLRRLKGTFVEIRKGGRRVRKAHTKQGQGLCPLPLLWFGGPSARQTPPPAAFKLARRQRKALRSKGFFAALSGPAARTSQSCKIRKSILGPLFRHTKARLCWPFLIPRAPTPRLFAAQGGNFLVCNIARIRAHTAAGVSLQTAKKGPFRCFLAYESPAESGAFQLNPDGAKGVHSPCLPAHRPPPYPPPAGEGSPLPAGR